jgi:glycosyltransferase involved in cell wall biosynthesis
MKIAYIVSLFPKLSETFILREMIGLEALGHRITVVSLKREREPIAHKEAALFGERTIHPRPLTAMLLSAAATLRRPLLVLRIAGRIAIAHTIGGRGLHPIVMLKSQALVPPALYLARRMREAGIQHVHAHWASYPALVAWIIGRVTGIPYSVTAHAHDLFLPNPMLAEKVRDAAFFATISEFNRALLLQACGPSALDTLRLIRCGIPLAEFPYGEPPRGDAEHPAHVVSVGRLVDYKGFDVLIRACRLLRDRGMAVRLTIVGEGPERRGLEALAAELDAVAMVTFAGSRRQEEVRGIMRHATLFALACVQGKDGQQDGIPIVLMEAMALGVPVVSTKLSGIPELVKDGETGLLARPGDPEHLAAAMARVIQDTRLAASLRRDARTWVEIEFNLDRWVAQLDDALAQAHRP